MVNSEGFFNEFAVNMSVFWPLVVGVVIILPVASYFYNRFIDGLDEHEHTSMYVAGGVLVTLLAGALFSWKAALLFLALFFLSGLPMIVGDYQRGKRKAKEQAIEQMAAQSQPRRKRLPYAANGLIDHISMAAHQAQKYLTAALKKRDDREEMLVMISLAIQEISTAQVKAIEIKQIQDQ